MELTKKVHRAFSDAIQAGDIDAVQAMVDRHPGLVNAPGWAPPPMHCAVLWDQALVAELLIAQGADLETLDPDRQTTALRYAVLYAKPQMLQLLIRAGANRGPIQPGGQSALELAQSAAQGDYERYSDMPAREEYEAIVALLESEQSREGKDRSSQ
ncbi:MAG: hypothetical protein Aurels2KO_41770 [Aureliella sp.]